MTFIPIPYAILPSINHDHSETENTVDRCIFNVLENKRYEWKNMFKGFDDAWCVGSSHNWLILLDNEGSPFLLNPFHSSSIQLPLFPHTLMPCVRGSLGSTYSYYVEFLRETFVSKAVLMSSPSPCEYTLAILYQYPHKIAFCRHDVTTWVELFDAKRCYCDILFHNNILYALAEDGSIEGWSFHEKIPSKTLDVKPTFEIDLEEEKKFPRDMFSTQFYLVISEGDFLLVERFIGNFVNAKGEVIYEGENSSFDHDEEICPYRTKGFNVYKLDLVKNEWKRMKSLNGQVLYLGVNESTSVPAALGGEENSIYFSDDRWEEMNLDYSYGGHDWGVFSLQDQSIKLFTPYAYKMDPPPVWILPANFTRDPIIQTLSDSLSYIGL